MSGGARESAAARRLSRILRSAWDRQDSEVGLLSHRAQRELQRSRLIWLRHELRLTRREMSRRVLRIDERSAELRWSRYEDGRSRISLDVMQQICARLGMPLSIFIEPRLTRLELHVLLDVAPPSRFAEIRRFLLGGSVRR